VAISQWQKRNRGVAAALGAGYRGRRKVKHMGKSEEKMGKIK